MEKLRSSGRPVGVMSPPAGPEQLIRALAEVRAAVGAAAYPFPLASADAARDGAATLLSQLDDYVIPRLRRLDAPILAVVGGSTGAGKSTLVNSLVRAPVSPAGVLRPTTRAPLIVCHPSDLPWFADRALLPRFSRSAGAGRQSLQVINAPALAPGVALLDAPDIDSVVADNRQLARELFAAGDLWLFVTTAVRYADAIPWQVLHDGRERGTAVAVVLDRVPAHARDDITIHFEQMLAAEGLTGTPVFVVTESTLDSQGLVSEQDVAPIKRWITGLSRDGGDGAGVIRQTLLGAVAAVEPRVDALARAADEQILAASLLAEAVREAYQAAWSDVESQLSVGAVLRGEVYGRWREMVANGDLRQALRTKTGPYRSQVSAALADRPMPGRRFAEAAAAALIGLIVDADATAAQRCRQAWSAEPAGTALLATDPTLGQPWPGAVEAAQELVATWQSWLRSVARAQAPRVRTRTRSYLTASTVLLGTVAAVSPPADQITASGVEPSMLRAVVESSAIRELGERARGELLARVSDLLGAQVRRHLAAISAVGVDPAVAPSLRDCAAALRHAWAAFADVRDVAAARDVRGADDTGDAA